MNKRERARFSSSSGCRCCGYLLPDSLKMTPSTGEGDGRGIGGGEADERRRRLPDNQYPILPVSVSVFAGLAAAISSGVVSHPGDRYSNLHWPALCTMLRIVDARRARRCSQCQGRQRRWVDDQLLWPRAASTSLNCRRCSVEEGRGPEAAASRRPNCLIRSAPLSTCY